MSGPDCIWPYATEEEIRSNPGSSAPLVPRPRKDMIQDDWCMNLMKPKPEWISVKDRLPEDFVDVLCCCINKFGQTFEVGEKYMSIDSLVVWTDTQERSFRTDRFYGEVTHWMPLPEPPKE